MKRLEKLILEVKGLLKQEGSVNITGLLIGLAFLVLAFAVLVHSLNT